MKRFVSLALVLALLMVSCAALATEAPADRELYTIKLVVPPTDLTSSENTEVGQYIKDRFGIVIEYAPYAGNLQELQVLQLASGDYGEIQSMEYEKIIQDYVKAGVLVDLDAYIDQLPDFQRVFADAIPYWRMGAGGKLLRWDTFLPRRGETDIEANDMLVRTDVLEHYGWPTLVTEDDWVAFLKQALIDFPETDGMPTLGLCTPFAEGWGLSFLATGNYEKGENFVELGNADSGVLFDHSKDAFVDLFLDPSVKDSYAFFNRLYREGILDPESLTDNCSAVDEKCMNGSAICVYYFIWGQNGYNEALEAAGNGERQYINMPIMSNNQAAQGQKRAIRVEDTRSYNAWGITDKCRYPERVVELLNWFCTDEGQILFRNGFEGKHWTRGEDGKRVLTDEGIKALTDGDYNLTVGLNSINFAPDFNLLLADGQYPNLMSHSEVYDQFALTERQRQAYSEMGWSSSKQWWADNCVFVATGLPGAIALETGTELADTAAQMYEFRIKTTAKLIIAESEEAFEQQYEAAVAEYQKFNPSSVVDEFNRMYQEQRAQLK